MFTMAQILSVRKALHNLSGNICRRIVDAYFYSFTMSQCVSPFQQNFVEFGLNICCWIADVDFYITTKIDFYIFYENKRFLQYCAAEWLMLILVCKQWHNIHSVSKGAAKLCKTCLGIYIRLLNCWCWQLPPLMHGLHGIKSMSIWLPVKKNTKARDTNCACVFNV